MKSVRSPQALALLANAKPVALRMRRIADKVESGELAGDGNTIVRCALAELKEVEVHLKLAAFLSQHGDAPNPKSAAVSDRISKLEAELAELKKAA